MLAERTQDSIFEELTSRENSYIIRLEAIAFSLICYTGSYP